MRQDFWRRRRIKIILSNFSLILSFGGKKQKCLIRFCLQQIYRRKRTVCFPCFYSLCPDDDTEVAVAHIFKDKEDAEPGSSSFKKVQSRVRAVVAELRRAGYENAREIYRSGEVFEQLTEIADDEDAGLIMVASHGKGFFKSALLGSTTFDLARATDRPLFVSKPVEDAGDELLRKICCTAFWCRLIFR